LPTEAIRGLEAKPPAARGILRGGLGQWRNWIEWNDGGRGQMPPWQLRCGAPF